MSRRAFAITLLVGVLVLAGCDKTKPAPEGATPSETFTMLPDPPPFTPVSGATRSSEVPRPLADETSVERVAEAAAAGPSRLDAEQYALAAAQLLADARPGPSAAAVVRRVAAAGMAPRTRDYLVKDLDSADRLGLGTHYDTGLEMWIRSQASGDTDAPRRVAVEVVANVASGTPMSPGWDGTRLDVVREHGEWRLISWSGGSRGLNSTTNLNRSQRRELLEGRGWRRIPPA
jgi:hypothetical protein